VVRTRTSSAPRGRAAQLLRVSRSLAASRRKERVRTKATPVALTVRSDPELGTASAAVGPTSGAAGVGRAPRRADRREHAGPCCDAQRRGIKSLMGATGCRGACRRHLTVRAGADCARLLRRAAGAQPSPGAEGGPRGSLLRFRRSRDLADSFTVTLTRATRLRAKHGECSRRCGLAGRALANQKPCPEMCLLH